MGEYETALAVATESCETARSLIGDRAFPETEMYVLPRVLYEPGSGPVPVVMIAWRGKFNGTLYGRAVDIACDMLTPDTVGGALEFLGEVYEQTREAA